MSTASVPSVQASIRDMAQLGQGGTSGDMAPPVHEVLWELGRLSCAPWQLPGKLSCFPLSWPEETFALLAVAT